MNDQSLGIVLGTQTYKEHDALVWVLLKEYGVRRFLYRGFNRNNSKMKNKGQLYHCYEFLFNYKEDGLLLPQSVALKESFIHLSTHVEKQMLASLLYELRSFISDQYELVYQYLSTLNQEKNPLLAYVLFLVQILHQQGLQPLVDYDVFQGSTKIRSFSIREGGFVSSSPTTPYNKEQLQHIRWLFKGDFSVMEVLNELNISPQIFELIVDYFEFHLNLRLKSWEIYQQIVYN
ncbi:MAG TPA: DNA repair protein RecO [Erysipelothrix sp.]|nr:DNA repair protein RecO [Erysipelothrix sp.]